MSEPEQMTWGGVNYVCTVVTEPQPESWAFPVGGKQYPPETWYASVVHSMDGRLNNPRYAHTGIDLNLDKHERGDVERRLGLSVYAVADGVVSYITNSWSGVPMLVLNVMHDGEPLWIRYAHIIPCVMHNEVVHAGQALGGFADWVLNDGGDHLHFDMCLDAIDHDWLTAKRWLDPVDVLKMHLDPLRVDAMLRKGG